MTQWQARWGCVLLFLAGLLNACGATGPLVRVEGVWARPAAGMGETGNGAVFMVLVNEGGEADRLLAARCDIAQAVEIHETRLEGDVMKMQPVVGGIEISAGGKVELRPGGYHIMLIGLKQDLLAGQRFAVELQFARGGTMVIEAEVKMP